MACINEIGNRYGKLVVLERDLKKSKKNAYWLCQCDCGKQTTVLGTKLRKGETKSCGCLRSESAKKNVVDITGQKFGRLTVLSRAGSTPGGIALWNCKCDCGTEKVISGAHLRNGTTVSCGCYNKELTKKSNSVDITNQKFGLLTAIAPTEERDGPSIVWDCLCECGNYKKVSACYLRQGNIKSCGCLKTSIGEKTIEKILIENNIPFEKEKIFDTCKFISGQHARFDFYIDNNYLVEYDGEQHFYYTGSGWNTEENFIKTQNRDKYKNEWCKENNIPLIRIPYTHLNNIKIEDLLLNTSTFIINKGEYING